MDTITKTIERKIERGAANGCARAFNDRRERDWERDLNDEEIDRDPIGRIFVSEEFEDIRNPRAFKVLMREKKKKEDSEMVRCE